MVAGAAGALVGCAQLLNYNTLNLSATVDELTLRQIIFNLVKTKQNKYALPAQATVTSGQVSAMVSATPNISFPWNTGAMATTQIVTGSTNTLTRSNVANAPNLTSTVSGTIQTSQDWNISPLLNDPEQLRRLRLLYQYATGQITQEDLLCVYPIPQRTTNPSQKSEPTTDSSRKPGETTTPGQKSQPTTDSSQKTKETTNPSARQSADDDKVYVRGKQCRHQVSGKLIWATVGPHPDPAFMNSPGCVLCAKPNIAFQRKLRGQKIYENTVSDEEKTVSGEEKTVSGEAKSHDAVKYVEVVLNWDLKPNGSGCGRGRDIPDHIDWLYVVPDGESVPGNYMPVGGSDGYTVYVTPVETPPSDDCEPDKGRYHFSEFVLAVIEATLEPPELAKRGPQPPPVVTTQGPSR